jgi:hypothetical protein
MLYATVTNRIVKRKLESLPVLLSLRMELEQWTGPVGRDDLEKGK